MQEGDMQKERVDRLQDAIRSSGLSLRELSEQSGVPYASLRDYASGKKMPGMNAFASIVKACRVSADWVLFGKERDKHSRMDSSLLALILTLVDEKFKAANLGMIGPELFSEHAEQLAKLAEGNQPDLPERMKSLPTYKRVAALRDRTQTDKAIVAAMTYEQIRSSHMDNEAEIALARERAVVFIDYAISLLRERDSQDQQQ
jgi:transcriptional regulator with XRE-family HTH domain